MKSLLPLGGGGRRGRTRGRFGLGLDRALGLAGARRAARYPQFGQGLGRCQCEIHALGRRTGGERE